MQFQEKLANGNHGELMRGRPAVEANFAMVKSMELEALGLKDLEMLRVFEFLLPGNAQQEATSLTERVFQKAFMKGAKPSIPKGSKAASKGKASQSAESSSTADAAAMFK